ncbi:MAG: T9SS type A sorting domain-containing protein [Flavobacteriales bacterium]|nr:T9SS type A sorting domain-containing protein [Flavobacteriales bacterium]
MDLTAFAKGLYLVKVTNDSKSLTTKIIVE